MGRTTIKLETPDPSHGDTVTLRVDPPEDQVVRFTCRRDGDVLLATSGKVTDLSVVTFDLSSDAWTEGPAECVAEVRDGSGPRVKTVARASFEVGP